MKMPIEIEQEDDGRWVAEVTALSGVMVYGRTREEAIARVEALALRVVADRVEHGESVPEPFKEIVRGFADSARQVPRC